MQKPFLWSTMQYFLLCITDWGQNVCFREIIYISMKFWTTLVSLNWNGALVILHRGNVGREHFFGVCFGDSYKYTKIKAVKTKCHIILQWKLYQDCEETRHRKFVRSFSTKSQNLTNSKHIFQLKAQWYFILHSYLICYNSYQYKL